MSSDLGASRIPWPGGILGDAALETRLGMWPHLLRDPPTGADLNVLIEARADVSRPHDQLGWLTAVFEHLLGYRRWCRKCCRWERPDLVDDVEEISVFEDLGSPLRRFHPIAEQCHRCRTVLDETAHYWSVDARHADGAAYRFTLRTADDQLEGTLILPRQQVDECTDLPGLINQVWEHLLHAEQQHVHRHTRPVPGQPGLFRRPPREVTVPPLVDERRLR